MCVCVCVCLCEISKTFKPVLMVHSVEQKIYDKNINIEIKNHYYQY